MLSVDRSLIALLAALLCICTATKLNSRAAHTSRSVCKVSQVPFSSVALYIHILDYQALSV